MSRGKGSADIDQGPASVGQELRQARQRRGKSLVDMSSALKISKDYLTALETGRFADLPSRVYAVGYVKSCAAYLGLDAADLVARFKTELTSAGISEPDFSYSPRCEGEPPPEAESDAARAAKPPTIRLASLAESAVSQAAVVLIIVGAVSYSLYRVTASIPAAMPVQLTAEGVSDRPVAHPLAVGLSRNLRQAEPPSLHEVPLQLPTIDVKLAIVEPRILKFVAPALSDSAKLALASSKPALSVMFKQPRIDLSRNMPVIESDVAAVAQRVSVTNAGPPARTMLRFGQHYGEDTKYSRITLRLHRPTAIRVARWKNSVLIDRALEAGDTFRVPDISGLRLSARDAGAIEIILDNTTVGFAGRRGVPAREISLEPKVISRLPRGR